MTERAGHCLCGATRYGFDPEALTWQAICHCHDCQRAVGAPFVGWLGVKNGGWRWTAQSPGAYVSSPGLTRYFCTTCGTSLAYYGERWPHETHFLAATLDDPQDYQPSAHVYTADALHWGEGLDDLPRFETLPNG